MSNLWLGTTWEELIGWMPMLLQAFSINLQVTLLTLIFGMTGGFFLALGLQAKNALYSIPAYV